MSIKTNMTKKIGLLGIDHFDGKRSVRKFLKNIDKRGRIERWTKKDKARIVICLCSGTAEAFLDINPQLANARYEILCRELINRFDTQFSLAEAYAELMSVKQKGDSVENFAYRIEMLASEFDYVIPELKDKSCRNELLVSAFMEGVNPILKSSLVLIEYFEFNVLVRTAKRLEKTYNSQRINVGTMDYNEREYPTNKTHSCNGGCDMQQHRRGRGENASYGEWYKPVHHTASELEFGQYEYSPHFEKNYWHSGDAYGQTRTPFITGFENVNRGFPDIGMNVLILLALVSIMTLIIFMVKMLEG